MRDRTKEIPPNIKTILSVVGPGPAEPLPEKKKRFIKRMRKSCYLDECNQKLDGLGRLREQYLHDGLALFLGAGVSACSEVPSWRSLIHEILGSRDTEALSLLAKFDLAAYRCEGKNETEKRRLFLEKLYEGLYGKLSPNLKKDLEAIPPSDEEKEQRVDLWPKIVKALSANTTLKAVGDLLLAGAPSPDGLCQLNRQIHAALTTNADNLLQMYLLACCGGRRLYSTVDRPSVGDHPGILSIYHLHGCLDARGEGFLDTPPAEVGPPLVFRESEYFETIANPTDFANYTAQSFFQRYNVLFIGTSLDDMNIRRWLYNSFQERWKQRTHYLIDLYRQPDKEAAAMEAFYASIRHFWLRPTDGFSEPLKRDIETVMQHLGVQIVWYENHSEIEEKLQKLTGRAGSGSKAG